MKDDIQGNRVASSLSLPEFHILSEAGKKPGHDSYTEVQLTQRKEKVKPNVMNANTTSVEIHHPRPRSSQTARTRRTSRHERHKCHKSKHKAVETLQITNQNLLERINELKRENYRLSRKLNASVTSIDSGLSQNEVLSPFELDVNTAYQHMKNENAKLSSEVERYRSHCNDLKIQVEGLEKDNRDLEGDVSMLKNLVYKLNIELERYQNAGGDKSASSGKTSVLPENYHKNFLKPVLPLLRAYSEAVQEKNEMIENFEGDLKRFSLVFNDILKENEKLYMELEKKINTVEGDAFNEVKVLRKDLEMAKQENSLLLSQIELEQEKLAEVHSVYRMKVAEVLKQNAAVQESLQEQKADLYMMKGKYSILKQEFERLKLDSDSKVPMAVHSASIGECKRLFQDLKNEYEAQKQHHLATIAEQEQTLTKLRKKSEEKLFDKEPGEEENLRRKFELANQGELTNIKKQLRESNTRVEELSSKLANTKKQLHKAMAFAEDIVREQESLLLQLHAKQKENNFMASHFGSLKHQLKSVEKGAQEGLNSVEEKMRGLEIENSKLSTEVKKMRSLLKEKEDVIARLEHPKDVWAIKEGRSGSENDSGTDSEEMFKKSELKCEGDDERKCQQQRSVSYEFGSGEFNLPESDYSNEDDRCCVKVMPEGRCLYEKEHCCHDCDMTEYRKNCSSKTKPHACKQTKPDNSRRRNPKEEADSIAKRFSSRYHSKSCSLRIRGHWERGENIHRCDEWCSRLQAEERSERKPMMLPYTKPYKHVHPLKKDRPHEWKWKEKEECHSGDCCCHKQKKKVLDSYEELPAVDEALERRSDETYKASSYTKFAMNAGDSQTNFPQNKTGDTEIFERTPSWFLCDKMSGTALNESLPYGMYQERSTKMRSRRTRINRKSVKWMKALVQPVVEGSRKEKVGVMILGRNGPEYYLKYSNKKLGIPFRKTRSFQEGPTKSYDMPFNFEPKEIFFSASDPGRKPRNELRTPEEDNKIDEKIADFDKNVKELVKDMEEKFLESISKDKFSDTKEAASPKKADTKLCNLEEAKRSQNLMPRELLSSRVPKSTRKYDRDVFAFNVESKTMAESLNERAKQFRIGQKCDLSELEKKFPPKPVDKETRDANLALWGMNELRELREVSDAGGEGDGNDISLRIPIRRNSLCTETQSKSETDEKRKDKPGEEKGHTGKECEKTPAKGEEHGKDQALIDIFKNLVKDGSAISEKESEKLQKMLQSIGYEPELTCSEIDSKTSCETIREKDDESKKDSSNKKHSEDCPSNRTLKDPGSRDSKWKSGKISKKRDVNLEKLKLIRQALPSMAAENEAAHLKQLKRYIHKFIDGVESKISSSSEVRGRRRARCKQRDTTSSDSSEVRVDARKLIDLVSNPFKRITSDMTIDMVRKLTDALVQENSSKTTKKLASKTRKNSEEAEDVSLRCPTTSRSDGEYEVEPGRTWKYVEGLKKMRNDHLNNIIMEVRRLRELIRFLDRCNRLKL